MESLLTDNRGATRSSDQPEAVPTRRASSLAEQRISPRGMEILQVLNEVFNSLSLAADNPPAD